jgi:ABC-type transport system involved in cytochrome c biogenesis permease subunit
MIIRLVAAAAAAMLATGCSLAAVNTPRERPAPPLRCKTQSAAPPVDAFMAVFALALGGATIIADQTSEGEFQGITTVFVGVPLVGLGTLYGLSSTYGFGQTARCRRFHRELGIPIPSGSTPR